MNGFAYRPQQSGARRFNGWVRGFALEQLALSIAALSIFSSNDAAAHPLAPALLELREDAAGVVAVRWKTSLWKQAGVALAPALPPHCTSESTPRREIDATSVTSTWTMRCSAPGLVGSSIAVDGAHRSQTDTLLRIELADGRSLHAVLRGEATSFVVPERPTRFSIARQYGALGLDHILNGFDHLLFVAGLVMLVPGRRALVRTVSAFTLGHSITLSLAALGYTAFPTEAIEVMIALTVLALAVELARPRASLMRRFPWAMAIAFGLLHGLGFAGALQAVGLPSGEIVAALLAFNAGIELGQLLFIMFLIALGPLGALVRRWSPPLAETIPVYAMGSFAAFWLIERTMTLL